MRITHKVRSAFFLALAGLGTAIALAPSGRALITLNGPPNYELTRLQSHRWQLVVPDDYTTVGSQYGQYIALGLSWHGDAITNVESMKIFRVQLGGGGSTGNLGGSVTTLPLQPVFVQFAFNAYTTSAFEALYAHGRMIHWNGFLAPSGFVPANAQAVVVMILDTATDDYVQLRDALFGGQIASDEATVYGSLTGNYPFVGSPVDIQAASVEKKRNPVPQNPDAFEPGATSGPVVGATWDPFVQPFLRNAAIDFMMISPMAMQMHTPYGMLLCTVPEGNGIMFTPSGTHFAVAIPNDLSLVGMQRCTQAGSFAPGGVFALTNAIDVTVGTF